MVHPRARGACGDQRGGFRGRRFIPARAGNVHIDPERARWLPFLEESITDPYEAWLAFEEHQGTGQIALRMRLIKTIDLGRDRGLVLVAQA